MKILNLNEGSFPIEMDLNLNSIDVPNVGTLKDTLDIKLKISKLSLNLHQECPLKFQHQVHLWNLTLNPFL